MGSQIMTRIAPVAVVLAGLSAHGADYQVDPAHSKIGFSVKHLMISNVAGSFKDFEGKFAFDPAKGTVSNANFVVQAKSINTENEKRDEHLRSADFFEVEKYPTITIANSKIKKAGKDKFKWTGDLTLHGVTKPVTLDLEYKGTVKDPWGVNRVGFEATGKINRKDYGLTWNKALETGGAVVGDEVKLSFEVEATEAKPEAPKTADAAK